MSQAKATIPTYTILAPPKLKSWLIEKQHGVSEQWVLAENLW